MKSSTGYTAPSPWGRAAVLSALIAALACAAGAVCPLHAAAGEDQRYSCKDEPWSGDDVRFVNDMLLKWRPDYEKLSKGEFRVYVRDVLLGLQPPGERYRIDTDKKGSIRFERKDGEIRCTIEQP
jgi:hypothetical protein